MTFFEDFASLSYRGVLEVGGGCVVELLLRLQA
jgi:hypothetical protein